MSFQDSEAINWKINTFSIPFCTSSFVAASINWREIPPKNIICSNECHISWSSRFSHSLPVFRPQRHICDSIFKLLQLIVVHNTPSSTLADFGFPFVFVWQLFFISFLPSTCLVCSTTHVLCWSTYYIVRLQCLHWISWWWLRCFLVTISYISYLPYIGSLCVSDSDY